MVVGACVIMGCNISSPTTTRETTSSGQEHPDKVWQQVERSGIKPRGRGFHAMKLRSCSGLTVLRHCTRPVAVHELL
ncbi:uncharacterized protein J3R85_016339 [Psidium guajava]|nr:uncharacterized protein J3R85_016339 [Psidium guajava]